MRNTSDVKIEKQQKISSVVGKTLSKEYTKQYILARFEQQPYLLYLVFFVFLSYISKISVSTTFHYFVVIYFVHLQTYL